MTLVSGPLSTVTADPTAVSVVQVSVQGPRTAGTGVQTHESKNVVVSGGVFSHEIAPGAATLTMIVGQQPGPPIPILVDDIPSQTLANAVNAAKVATPDNKEWLEKLAAEVIAGTQGPMGEPGPAGPKGDPGDKGDPGATGSLDLIDESVQTTIDTVVAPAIEGARDEALGQVEGAVAAEVDAIKWKRGMLPQDITTLAEVPDGDWIVANAAHATTLGLPSPLISRISKHSFGTAIFYLVTTGGSNPQSWLRYGNTGEWKQLASLNDVPAPWWRGTSQIPAGETLETIAVGEYTIWSASHATTLGLPTSTQGELVKRAFGNTRTYEWTAFFPDSFEEWRRRVTTAGVDTGWVKASVDGESTAGEVSAAGMKLVPLSLSLGQGATTAAGGAKSGSFRVPIRYNATITRWRLCFTNRNPRYGTTRNAQSVVSSVVVGAHTDGAYSATPTTVATNLSVSADGSVARTGWQTTPIGDGRDMAISYRYTTSGQESPPLLVGGGWDLGTSSPSTLNPSKTRVIRLPFDMWIEAETYATTPVIAGFGDSITCGVGATVPVFDSWPNVYARTVNALPMHYSSSGDTFENWSLDEKAYKVNRWDHLARPDAVLWAMGTNDMASARTFAQHQENTQKMVEIIRERWSPNLYLATIMPRNNEAADLKTMREQWNAWATDQPDFRDTFDFAAAIRDPETGGILPEYNADGLHLSSAGSGAQAAAITRPIANHVVSELQAADEALRGRVEALETVAPMVWVYHGTGIPTLAGFPGARVGDVIRRMSDGQEWRVDA